MKLSIVIPCYNEAKTIRLIVDRVRSETEARCVCVSFARAPFDWQALGSR